MTFMRGRRWARGRAARSNHDFGLGLDLCDVRRIEKTIARHGDRFPNCAVLRRIERAQADRRANVA